MEILTQSNSSEKSKGSERLLVESRPVQLQLVEDKEKSGKVVMRGEFARCGVATENKRIYPQKLWEREIVRLNKAMEERRLFGELDHPAQSRTDLARVSHIITKLEVKDGVVIGEAEVLDTAKGKDLKAILQSTGACGISSRGYGSVRTNERGEDVVQEDYRLVTFDFVADPADQTAFPEAFYESKGSEMDRDENKIAEEFARQIEAARKESRENAEASLKEEFAKELVTRMETFRAEIAEEVRGELLSDPSVAGARTVLDHIKALVRPYILPADVQTVTEQKNSEISSLTRNLAEKELKIKELEEEIGKLSSMAKEAGFKFFVEKAISGDPDSELIRKLIGDVTKYTSSEDLGVKVEEVRADLQSKRAEAASLAEQIEADKTAQRERKEKERVRAVEREKSLAEENEKLRTALSQSMEAADILKTKVYAEGRLVNHPKAAKIRPLIEASNSRSKEEVDSIIEKFREPAKDAEALEGVRSRIRKATGGGLNTTPLDEERQSPLGRQNTSYNNLGLSIDELRTITGLNK